MQSEEFYPWQVEMFVSFGLVFRFAEPPRKPPFFDDEGVRLT